MLIGTNCLQESGYLKDMIRSSSLILPTNKHTGRLTYGYLDILSFIGSLTDKLSGFRE